MTFKQMKINGQSHAEMVGIKWDVESKQVVDSGIIIWVKQDFDK